MSADAPDAVVTAYTDWKGWQQDRFGQTSRNEARYFGWLLGRCHPGPAARVLEIGYGNGAFVGFMRGRGSVVSGIEVQPALRERAQAAGVAAYAALQELPAGSRFELIAAFDVLEHIEQSALPAFVGTLAAHLAPGGTLLLRVPNGESPFGRIHQHGDLTHVSTLGLSKFRQLAAVCGLAVAWHGEVPWHVTARGPKAWLRGLVRRAIERLVAFGWRWDLDALSPNLVVALRPAATAPR